MFPETQNLADISSVNSVAVGKRFLFDFATGDFVVLTAWNQSRCGLKKFCAPKKGGFRFIRTQNMDADLRICLSGTIILLALLNRN